MNYEKTESIRDVLRYVKRFKNTLIVIHIDDAIIDSPLFSSHIKDIAYINKIGINVIMVPGAKNRIDDVLSTAGIFWTVKNSIRITGENAMPLIKMAAFDVANRLMTGLAGEQRTALIGNWVQARSKGIINGEDFGTAGEIDRIQLEAIQKVLHSDLIPIFPCIGWSAAGRPYNVSSVSLAAEIASRLKAEKLFFLTPEPSITMEQFFLPAGIKIEQGEPVHAMNLEETAEFIKLNTKQGAAKPSSQLIRLLSLAAAACNTGVTRSHLVNGLIDGALLCEIFSGLGQGTMIYKSDYGGIRNMTVGDIPAVLNLMRPFIKKGILLPRTEQILLESYSDYIVYEMDGGIKACSALHLYSKNSNEIIQAEIAALAVDEAFSRIGLGPKMVSYLVGRAKAQKALSIFVLTTQTADWFEQQGFIPDDIKTLPDERKKTWSKKRGSKLFRLEF